MNIKSTTTSSESSEEIIKPGYVRVSSIVGTYMDFTKIDPLVLKRKCDIGISVHNAIDAYLKDEFYPLGDDAQKYMGAFYSAYNAELSDYKILRTEERFYHDELKITGKIDLLAEKDDKTYLIDYKTSYAKSIPSWSIQMALYALLLTHNQITSAPNALVLHLKKNASYGLISIKLTKQLLDLAKSAVDLYWHFH